MTQSDKIIIYGAGLILALIILLIVFFILANRKKMPVIQKYGAILAFMIIGAILIKIYPPDPDNAEAYLGILGIGFIALPLFFQLIFHFIVYEKQIKTRMIESANYLAESLQLEIYAPLNPSTKMAIHELQFGFKKQLKNGYEIRFYREHRKLSPRSTEDRFYRWFYQYFATTPQTEEGFFLVSNKEVLQYAWEQEGYQKMQENNALTEHFQVFLRNPTPHFQRKLTHPGFVKFLLDHENYLMEPLKYNFNKYQLELAIQHIPNKNPRYGIFQFEKAIQEEREHDCNELKAHLEFIESLLLKLNNEAN